MPEPSTYTIDLCDACASGVNTGNYVPGCAFCDVGLHPHDHLYEYGWLKPQATALIKSHTPTEANDA